MVAACSPNSPTTEDRTHEISGARYLALILIFTCFAVQAHTNFEVSESTATIKNAAKARKLKDKLHDFGSVLDYGAVCDATVLRWTNVAINAGSAQLTVEHGWFDPKNAGKLMVVAGAGKVGSNLSAKIASVQSKSQVVLTEPAGSSVTINRGYVAYGADDAPAINAVLDGTSSPIGIWENCICRLACAASARPLVCRAAATPTPLAPAR